MNTDDDNDTLDRSAKIRALLIVSKTQQVPRAAMRAVLKILGIEGVTASALERDWHC